MSNEEETKRNLALLAFFVGKSAFLTLMIGLQDRNGNHTLRVSQSTSEVQIRLIFGYEEDPSGFLATSVRSFSGGYVKDSAILNRVISVEYVPLMGGFHEIELDCAVLLPGVELPGVDFFP